MITTSNNTITATIVNTHIGYVYIIIGTYYIQTINKNNTGR